MMGSLAEGSEVENVVWWRWFVWEKHKERSQEMFSGKGERLTYSGLGRAGPVSCQTSRIPGWEHWLNQPQEGCAAGKFAKSFHPAGRIWHQIRKPVGEVAYSKSLKSAQGLSLHMRTGWNIFFFLLYLQNVVNKTLAKKHTCESSPLDTTFIHPHETA